MEKRLQNLIWDKGIKYFVKKKKIRRNIMKLEKKYKSTRNKMKIKIRGATAPKSQDRLKRLLPDGSTGGGLVVSKALNPQP